MKEMIRGRTPPEPSPAVGTGSTVGAGEKPVGGVVVAGGAVVGATVGSGDGSGESLGPTDGPADGAFDGFGDGPFVGVGPGVAPSATIATSTVVESSISRSPPSVDA